MLLWPYLGNKLGYVDKTTLVGAVVGIISGFVVYFDSRFSEILKWRREITHESLGDSIKGVFLQNRYHVNCLRIRAVTTEVILPMVRDIPCTIGECRILLHRFEEDGRIKHAAHLNSKVQDIIEGWRALEASGKIGQLTVKLYADMPHSYTMIFDDFAVINGLYTPNDVSPHGNDFHEPVVLINKSAEMGTLIKKYLSWFDSMFSYYR